MEQCPKCGADLRSKLRLAREKLGVTQADIAEGLGVRASTVSRWETTGIDRVPAGRLASIAEAYGMSMKTLLKIAGEP